MKKPHIIFITSAAEEIEKEVATAMKKMDTSSTFKNFVFKEARHSSTFFQTLNEEGIAVTVMLVYEDDSQ